MATTPFILTPPAPPAGTFLKFMEFRKMEETADGEHRVIGIATLQEPDSDNEVCDYETAVPVYQAWSSKALKRTSGNGQEQSLGNIRVQHGSEVGGKVVAIEFKDDKKEIWLTTEPLSTMVEPLQKGMYTGYSQGGSYAWRACIVCADPMTMAQGANYCKTCKKNVPVLYGLKRVSEVSYVDSPAIGIGFESVKANGSTEIVKFRKKEIAPVAKTKRVANEDLEASAFAHVGDPEKTETWKLPIKFSTAEKTKRHIRNALARVDQTKGMSDEDKAKAKEKIHAAATENGIDVAGAGVKATADRANIVAKLKAHIETTALAKGITIEKSLYDVARCADILMALTNLWECAAWELEIEGDDSNVPDELRELLDGFVETFIAMATEEARELAARTNKTNKGETNMTPEELQKQQDAEKAAKKSLASHFAKAANHHEKLADHHEGLAEDHTEMAEAHKAAHSGMHKNDTNEGEQADAKGSGEFMAAGQQFHKAAAAIETKKAAKNTKMAKLHKAMGEHCDKMAAACDEDEAKKVAKELKDADAVIAKAEKENPTVPAPDDFTTRATKMAQENLMKDPAFMKEVEAEQRKVLLGKLAEQGAAAIVAETIVPTTVKTGAAAAGAATIVPRAGGEPKVEFAKDSATGDAGPGF